MATVLVRNNFPDIFGDLLAAIDTIYIQSRDMEEAKSDWKKLFSTKKSDRQFENVTGFTGFGQFSTVGEAEDVPLMAPAQLFDKKFTHTKFAGAWQVSEEMEDDDQYEFVAGLARSFARSFRFTKQVNHANVLNNGFSGGTETAADGVTIFNTHTLWNGTTAVNGVATDLGVSSAQTMFNYFATLTDDQGIRVGLRPKYFAAAPHMKWVYREVFGSSLKPYVATNETNALAEEELTPIWWPEITDTDAWYCFADPGDVDGNCLRSYDRQAFTTSTDFDTKNLTMISVGRGRWSRGCIDWRGAYGSAGA